jgi:hypothetical protein
MYTLRYTLECTQRPCPPIQHEDVSKIVSMCKHVHMQTCTFTCIHIAHHAHRLNTLHLPVLPLPIVYTHARAHGHAYTYAHTRTGNQNWIFLNLAKPQTAENQTEVEQSDSVKGEEMQGRENEVCVGGVRQQGAKEPSAEEKKKKKLDRLKKGKSSDRAGMQAVIRIASTVSRSEEDRQTGCTCGMVITSLDNVGNTCACVYACACACMHA